MARNFVGFMFYHQVFDVVLFKGLCRHRHVALELQANQNTHRVLQEYERTCVKHMLPQSDRNFRPQSKYVRGPAVSALGRSSPRCTLRHRAPYFLAPGLTYDCGTPPHLYSHPKSYHRGIRCFMMAAITREHGSSVNHGTQAWYSSLNR
jgi:hypothetical protein